MTVLLIPHCVMLVPCTLRVRVKRRVCVAYTCACVCCAQVATLVKSVGVVPEEEGDKEGWLESKLLAGGLPAHGAHPSPVNTFLDDVVAHRPGTRGAEFATLMRFIVPEDAGNIPAENAAVATAAAAALKLSGLAGAAKEFAEAHPAPVTPELLALTGAKRRSAARRLKADLHVPDAIVAAWTTAQGLRQVIESGIKAAQVRCRCFLIVRV